MLADLYIPRLLNDMKIAVQKNNLACLRMYRSLEPSKKNGVNIIYISKELRHSNKKIIPGAKTQISYP